MIDYGAPEDRREGLRLTPPELQADAAIITAAWPELHVDVKFSPMGQKVGVMTEHGLSTKPQRDLSGMLLGHWRKLLNEPPVWGLHIGELMDCSSVLVIGGRVRDWRDDLVPAELWGRWGVWGSRIMVMPVQDPATLARGSAGRWGEQVSLFFEGAVSGVGTWGLSGECVRGTCGKRLWKYDKDGVAWCEEHWTERYPSVKVKKAKAVREGKIGERMVL